MAEFKILEINARPWWYVELASRCGVDVCTMSYRDAFGSARHKRYGVSGGPTLHDVRD